MNQIHVGIIGVGFIGVSHIEGLLRLGFIRIVAVADTNYEAAKRCAARFGIARCYEDYHDLIADPEIESVHNCTPNFLHREINLEIIQADKHIFSEKPLALSSAETAELLDALDRHPRVIDGMNFCYRFNPLIQDAKNRIGKGEIGRPLLVHGSYLQDWMLYESDYNWRVEPEYCGPSRAVSDIGSHWMDLAQVLLNARIVEVCAQTLIVYPTRKKPVRQVETFARADSETTDVEVKTEDYAGVLVRFENGTAGSFNCSQVSAGRKCYIEIEIDGSLSSLAWQHQQGDRMWKGHRDAPNEEVLRNPLLMTAEAQQYTTLAAGHPEGWNDAFKNALSSFYSYVRSGESRGEAPCDFATFSDGHYLLLLAEAILKSAREKRWVKIDDPHRPHR